MVGTIVVGTTAIVTIPLVVGVFTIPIVVGTIAIVTIPIFEGVSIDGYCSGQIGYCNN